MFGWECYRSVMSNGCSLASNEMCKATSLEFVFFFFQAEDGIRDYKVTGVQTCALPISEGVVDPAGIGSLVWGDVRALVGPFGVSRSELTTLYAGALTLPLALVALVQIGRASCRERG